MNEGNSNSSETDNLINKIVFGKYKILKKIGAGSQSLVYLGEIIKTKENVAIKVEKETEDSLLKKEIKVLIALRNLEGIVNIVTCGRSGGNLVIVEELLGKSLDVLYLESYKNFTLFDVCKIAIQCLDRIKFIHSKGLIHCDIKPENFAIGLREPDVIYLLDFGLCEDYKDIKTGKHKEFSFTGYMTGTARYASRNALRGKQLSRRDDLESFIYMILYFLSKRLPWQGLKAKSVEGRYKKIYKLKKEFNYKAFCKNFPREIAVCIEYIRDLAFTEKPNYAFLKKNFMKILEDNKFKIYDNFSWAINMKEIKFKKKTSLSESKTKIKEQKKQIRRSIIGNDNLKQSTAAISKLKLSNNFLFKDSTINLGESTATVYENENKECDNDNIINSIKEVVEEEIKDEEKSSNIENDTIEDEENDDNENDENNTQNNKMLSIKAKSRQHLGKYEDDDEEKKNELKKELSIIKETDKEYYDDDDDIENIYEKRGKSVHINKIDIDEFSFNKKKYEIISEQKIKEASPKKEEIKLNEINNINKNESEINDEKTNDKIETNISQNKEIEKNENIMINENQEKEVKEENEIKDNKEEKEIKEEKEKTIEYKKEEEIKNITYNNKPNNEIEDNDLNHKKNNNNNTILNDKEKNIINIQSNTIDDKMKYASFGSDDFMKKGNTKINNKIKKGNNENNHNCFII